MSFSTGYASRDITPAPGITLSGFSARCNHPAEGIDDPLAVHALVIGEDERRVLLLVFDLLGLGPEVLERIHGALDAFSDIDIPRERRVLCCTHTHSAPATITLIGCGIFKMDYWAFLIQQTVEAASEACCKFSPAVLRLTSIDLPGANYNRRRVLSDGRVVMAQFPDTPVAKVGPTWDSMLLLRFDELQGNPIAGVVHWAAHPCTVCGENVSADYPGELRRRLSEQFGMPFLFLQGACANLNPPLLRMTRDEMLENVGGLMASLVDAAWPHETVETVPFRFEQRLLTLPYAPLPDEDDLREISRGMSEIMATGRGPEVTMAILGNILNVAPGEEMEPVLARYIAGNMLEWSDGLLGQPRESLPTSREIQLAVLRLGRLAFCFVAAETFVETAIELQKVFPELTVLTAGYASPVEGYLPTDIAMGEGGYEADSAYRFYNHPAPFAPGAEGRVRAALVEMIGSAV